MKRLLESAATWTGGMILPIIAKLNPEVLQSPGGSVIAMLLAMYPTVTVVFAGRCKWLACAGLAGNGGFSRANWRLPARSSGCQDAPLILFASGVAEHGM